MQVLKAHPDTPPKLALDLAGTATVRGDLLVIRYRLTGDLSRLVLPPQQPATRRNGLWQTTCFEAFVAHGDASAYREINFAPSSNWAAYDFDTYRSGMRDAPTTIERSWQSRAREEFHLDVQFLLPMSATRIGLSAVIEEIDGTKSFWALRHPPGNPDFHHPDCFAFALPAPEGS